MKKAEENAKYTNITLKDYYGEDIVVHPKFIRYLVKDFTGKQLTIPGISLTMDTPEGPEPFAVITKSFGEFIGMKDCAYIDTNNCNFTNVFVELGLAKPTGFTKRSGFCEYPLWKFDKGFLQAIGGAEYEEYSKEFDQYMRDEFGRGYDDCQSEEENIRLNDLT